MEYFGFGILFIAMFALHFGASWLDNKHGLQLVDWLNGEVGTPFNKDSKPQQDAHDNEVIQLKERVQVLEKIVTDEAYELNQQIKNLAS